MTPIEKLRRIADSTALDGVADAIREVADEMDDHAKLLHMIAVRASTFPRYPMGSHLPEVFAAVGMEQPKADVADEMDWRPIETAPKDGTVILLGYTPNPRHERHVYEGRWHEDQGTWTSVNGFIVHEACTHWMPLPAAPKGSE